MSARINVLIPDGHSTWAHSVIQCLSQCKEYKLYVLSNKKRTPTKYSRHTSYYKFYERPDENSWLNIINNEIRSNGISVIIPIAETEISFFIRYKVQISNTAKIVPLPDFKDFEIATNKKNLGVFAQKFSIPHPKSYYISSEADKKKVLNSINFPILIKPLNLKGGDGIIKINSTTNFPNQSVTINHPIYVQEYIEGYDIDCSVICLNGQILSYTIQKGNLEGDNPYAPQLGFEFLENDKVFEIAKKTMSKLNWSGVAHLDLRFDKHKNEYKLIEINARFWGSIEASKSAGINFPILCVQLALEQEITHKEFKKVDYMRLKGVIKSIKKRPLFILKTKFLLNNTEVKSFLNDPIPTVYRFREWLGRRF